MEIPEKIRLYIGKTVNPKEKIVDQLQTVFSDKFEIDQDNKYGNFVAFTVSLDCTRFVYLPCQIYNDILKGKRKSGKVVLTLT